MITTRALAAAFRLATSLPVHVHPRREREQEQRAGGHPGVPATRQRRAMIRAWWRDGISTEEMAARLSISRRAAQFHLKAIRAEGRRD